jgi:hypothetical protein
MPSKKRRTRLALEPCFLETLIFRFPEMLKVSTCRMMETLGGSINILTFV